jgi:electron transfer flavoprotein alpha subunit
MPHYFSDLQAPGPLTIAVCVKQVPLTGAMRFDTQTRRLVREGVPLEMNELDVYALSEAIRLRHLHGGEVIALTMGPPQARETLAVALAMGADRTLHLNDRAFAGADTAATARALAVALQTYFPEQHPVDLIFCGRHSVDAETAQVGPEIAEMLDLPQISAAQKIEVGIVNGQRVAIVTRETDDGTETLQITLPALITTAEKLNAGIWPDEAAIRQAEREAGERIQVVTAADLPIGVTQLGQPGSPTWVADVVADAPARSARILAESDPVHAVELLIADLQERGLLHLSDTPAQPTTTTPSPTAHPLRQGPPLPGKAVWVIAERANEGMRRVTLELLGKGNELAAQLQGELAAVLLGGPDVGEHVPTLAAYGAERVYVAAHPTLFAYTTERYTDVLAEAIRRYQPAVVLLGSTADGRDLAPRLAARLALGLTGDCIDLGIDEQQRLIQYKPAFGGSILSSILSATTPAMATLRPGILTAATPDSSRTATIEPLPIPASTIPPRVQILDRHYQDTGVAALEAAHTILGVGMGMGTPQHYPLVYQLATLLHAAIGATRNVTDQGWLPKQIQVGLTGHAVSPQLYLALGVRGAIEHIAGIRKARYVVSINKNKRAAIFKYSDLGVIGDVHVLLPLLIERLQAM